MLLHCIIHREALASKNLQPELSGVLQTAVKIVNFIKSRASENQIVRHTVRTMNHFCFTQKSDGFLVVKY